MAGTIVVQAELPGIGRAGSFRVVVDGVTVGDVRQGAQQRFPVASGTHTVRITAKDRITHSNTVTVEVVEGGDCLVTARGTGLGIAIVLPVLAGIAVPPVFAVAAVVLTGALFFAVPGLMFRVRAEGDPALRTARAAQGDAEERSGTGLWWESDPALAKRFSKNGDV